MLDFQFFSRKKKLSLDQRISNLREIWLNKDDREQTRSIEIFLNQLEKAPASEPVVEFLLNLPSHRVLESTDFNTISFAARWRVCGCDLLGASGCFLCAGTFTALGCYSSALGWSPAIAKVLVGAGGVGCCLSALLLCSAALMGHCNSEFTGNALSTDDNIWHKADIEVNDSWCKNYTEENYIKDSNSDSVITRAKIISCFIKRSRDLLNGPSIDGDRLLMKRPVTTYMAI